MAFKVHNLMKFIYFQNFTHNKHNTNENYSEIFSFY